MWIFLDYTDSLNEFRKINIFVNTFVLWLKYAYDIIKYIENNAVKEALLW